MNLWTCMFANFLRILVASTSTNPQFYQRAESPRFSCCEKPVFCLCVEAFLSDGNPRNSAFHRKLASCFCTDLWLSPPKSLIRVVRPKTSCLRKWRDKIKQRPIDLNRLYTSALQLVNPFSSDAVAVSLSAVEHFTIFALHMTRALHGTTLFFDFPTASIHVQTALHMCVASRKFVF